MTEDEIIKAQAEVAARWRTAGCCTLPGLSSYERDRMGLDPYAQNKELQRFAEWHDRRANSPFGSKDFP